MQMRNYRKPIYYISIYNYTNMYYFHYPTFYDSILYLIDAKIMTGISLCDVCIQCKIRHSIVRPRQLKSD